MLAHPALHPLLERVAQRSAGRRDRSAALPDTRLLHLPLARGRPPGDRRGRARLRERRPRSRGRAVADAERRGVPLLIDPARAAYTIDPAGARHASVRPPCTTRSSSTGVRSRCRPGRSTGRSTAEAQAHAWRTNPGFDYLEASHDGYAPLIQRRHVLALHGDLLVVADLVDGGGTHDVQVHWHLDPRWKVDIAGRRALLRSAGERIEFAVSRGLIDRHQATGVRGLAGMRRCTGESSRRRPYG